MHWGGGDRVQMFAFFPFVIRPGGHYYGLYGEATPGATQWPIQGKARGARPPLLLEKTERPEGPKKNFGDRSPSPLFKVLDDRAPPLSQGLDPALLLIHNTMVTMDYVHVI